MDFVDATDRFVSLEERCLKGIETCKARRAGWEREIELHRERIRSLEEAIAKSQLHEEEFRQALAAVQHDFFSMARDLGNSGSAS